MMVEEPTGHLRRPSRAGMMAPCAVTDVLAATEAAMGEDEARRILNRAGLFRAPPGDDPVPQDTVARLHAALRDNDRNAGDGPPPPDAGSILRAAGLASADWLIASQLSARARTMLRAAPWTVSAWLLGRWAGQNSWTFAGDGDFAMLPEMEFEIRRNPLAEGGDGTAPCCAWQEAVFERLFQRLVDPRLICREMTCLGARHDRCVFAFMLREGETDPEGQAPRGGDG